MGNVSDGKQGSSRVSANTPSYFAAPRIYKSRVATLVEAADFERIDTAIAGLRTCADGQPGEPAMATGGKAHSDDILRTPHPPKRDFEKN